MYIKIKVNSILGRGNNKGIEMGIMVFRRIERELECLESSE